MIQMELTFTFTNGSAGATRRCHVTSSDGWPLANVEYDPNGVAVRVTSPAGIPMTTFPSPTWPGDDQAEYGGLYGMGNY